MLKIIKKVTLLITCFVFTMTAGSNVMAFNDISEDSWYTNYVVELTNEGIFTPSENFRPDSPLNRAELAKIIVTAVDGLDEYTQPAQNSFDDVADNTWFYDYVEAAVQMEIVNGYKDNKGNLTGKFGPDDLVTRAAAAKVLIQAFDIKLESDLPSTFNDIDTSMWFYDYVNTAQKHSLVSGYSDGRFGAADPITRAQIAKMISLAKQKENTSGTPKETQQEATINSESSNTLLVTPLPLEQGEQTVPRGTSIPLVRYAFTAGKSNVNIEQLTLTRTGVGDATDWLGAFVYADLFKVSSEHSFGQDTNQSNISTRLLIPAEKTTIITFYADTSLTSIPGNEHYFQLQSADDIKTDAEIVGDFSHMGKKVTIGNLYPNTLTVQPGSTPARPRGPHSEIASIKATAGNAGDVQLNALILNKAGSVNNDEVTDCSLYINEEFISSSAGLYNDELIFAFEKPHIVKAGHQARLSARCNVSITASQDTIKFYLDESYDFLTTDLDFGYPAVPLNGYTQDAVTELRVR